MNIKLDKMKYQISHLSYYLGFLAIGFNVLYIFTVLNFLVPTAIIGIKILLNIGLLLMSFLAIEKAKVYSKPYSILLIFFGVICLLRFFYVPYHVWNGTITLKANQNANEISIRLTLYLVIMAMCYFISGINALIKHIRLKHYLANKGDKELEID